MKKYVTAVLRKLGKRERNTVVGVASSESVPAVEATDVQFTALSTLIEVDTYRQRLAAGDPALDQVLGGIELTLAYQLGRQTRQR